MASPKKSRPWRTFPLRKAVIDVATSLAAQCEDQMIETIIDVPAELMVSADLLTLRRAIENLMLGAIAAMPHGGTLVATAVVGPKTVELEIADSGPPLSDEGRRHAFDPSGMSERGVSGWEMAMVRRIAELHGGRVTVVNCPDGGVAFTLQIPLRAALENAA
jgi:signal transduction histidine kinase